jgi:hypothetical protein
LPELRTDGVSEVKELRFEMRIRNNRLLKLKESTGLTVPAFCDAVGISMGVYYELVNLRASPRRKDTRWREGVVKLSEYAGILPEDLFPPVVEAVKESKIVKELSGENVQLFLERVHPTLQQLPTPDEVCAQRELEEKTQDLLASLSAVEREVIERRFGFTRSGAETLAQIADSRGVTSQAIRGIESRALRKMRHPSRAKFVSAFGAPDSLDGTVIDTLNQLFQGVTECQPVIVDRTHAHHYVWRLGVAVPNNEGATTEITAVAQSRYVARRELTDKEWQNLRALWVRAAVKKLPVLLPVWALDTFDLGKAEQTLQWALQSITKSWKNKTEKDEND